MGKQELGETVTACAVRETEEETGVKVSITGLLGIFSDPGHIVVYHSNGETRQEYEVIFVGEPMSGQTTVNDELSAVRWYTRDDLPGLDMNQSQRRQLGHWLNGTYPHFDWGSLPPRQRPGLQRGLGRDRKPVTYQVTTTPALARPGATASDCCRALT